MLAKKLVMVRPKRFFSNPETRATNSFQSGKGATDPDPEAIVEFDAVVQKLKDHHIDVMILDSSLENSPDAIFPNNWFATLPTKVMITFPMLAINRRVEREPQFIELIADSGNYEHKSMAFMEKLSSKAFLEGTGSLVLDHDNKIGYAALSPRTYQTAVNDFEYRSGYKVLTFDTSGVNGIPIFHTNVLLTLGEGYAVVGINTIHEKDRIIVERSLQQTGRELIKLTNDQVLKHFAGNMLQVLNAENQKCLLMSENAFNSLTEEQQTQLNKYNDKLISFDIPTIERLGGGSLRCMLAELY